MVPSGIPILKTPVSDQRNLRWVRSPENTSVGIAVDLVEGFWGRAPAFLRVTPPGAFTTTTTTTTTTTVYGKNRSKRKIEKEWKRKDDFFETNRIPPPPPTLIPIWSSSSPVAVEMTPILTHQSALLQSGWNLIPMEHSYLYPLQGYDHSRETFFMLPTPAGYQGMALP